MNYICYHCGFIFNRLSEPDNYPQCENGNIKNVNDVDFGNEDEGLDESPHDTIPKATF